jgi:hypothetical protein
MYYQFRGFFYDFTTVLAKSQKRAMTMLGTSWEPTVRFRGEIDGPKQAAAVQLLSPLWSSAEFRPVSAP